MGRTTRWLRSLWSGKKEKKELKDYPGGHVGIDDRREKKRWSFGKSAKDPAEAVLGRNASTAAAVEAAWFRSFYAESEKEQSKHAIAVAAATAAAADAAVAAAQAAVTVVRLTSQGRGGGLFLSARDLEPAAVMIQKAFRGFLARKALRAMKALVKVQALVRGYLVRRQAAATLHSMQALIRAQAAVRAQRTRNVLGGDRKLHPEFRARRSLERFDETRSEKLPSLHRRRLSACIDNVSNGFDTSPKVVEIDTCRPKSRSSRLSNPSLVDPADDWHSSTISSPLPCHVPARISTVHDCRNFQDYDWCLAGERCRVSATAQSTPRFINSSCNPPLTPAKSVCGAEDVLRRFMNVPNSPNYMASTQSFEAKSRSQSAPKQRPMRRRMPLTEVMLESRASLSGVGMQRSCARVQEAFNFKSAVVGRLDRSSEFYLQRKSKALRALKALVKLQALVRGYLVRRQAAAALHSMQAIIRAQAAVRAQRTRNLLRSGQKLPPEFHARRSLERFDETRSEKLSSLHSRKLSACLDNVSNGFDASPKVVEIDSCRPKSRSSRRSNPSVADPADDWHSSTISSPLPCHVPARISIPDCRNFQEYDWCLAGERCRTSATAHSTPRFINSSCNPLTPAKSVCGADDVLRRFMNVPNSPHYMASTQSFEAKSRSQSAPKQRPSAGIRKRMPLTEVMLESRASLSGVGMQRSCSRVQEAFNFKSALVGRLDRSTEFGREAERREFYLQRKS
ncbi:hypothetical protein Cni_G10762 [Canna indica]|uniref:DUF4005 domain-containing protein n=1 Tax=Canna indica TaxID=4628 RepID=A0AAQ3K4S9_9LILI|nr:hypothetical protein Cni_G10762 [Canna indica]